MGRIVDTILAFLTGCLVLTTAYIAYNGLLNFRIPSPWILTVIILFLATAWVGLDPIITGNIPIDVLIAGGLTFVSAAILINGAVEFYHQPPNLHDFLVQMLVLSLLVRGYLWAIEEVTLDI